MLLMGDCVRIRKLGTEPWCYGVVALASDPERPEQSLAVILEGMVQAQGGAWIGGMLPLIVIPAREKVISAIDGTEYEVEYR